MSNKQISYDSLLFFAVRLRTALKEFGSHKKSCPCTYLTLGYCNCGFESRMKELKWSSLNS